MVTIIVVTIQPSKRARRPYPPARNHPGYLDTIAPPTSFPSISTLRSLSGTKNSAVPQLKQISNLGKRRTRGLSSPSGPGKWMAISLVNNLREDAQRTQIIKTSHHNGSQLSTDHGCHSTSQITSRRDRKHIHSRRGKDWTPSAKPSSAAENLISTADGKSAAPGRIQ